MGTRYIKVYQLACDDINNTAAFLNLAGEAFKLLKANGTTMLNITVQFGYLSP